MGGATRRPPPRAIPDEDASTRPAAALDPDTEGGAPAGDTPVPVVPVAQPWTALGPRDAPAIVFIHGTRLSRSQWLPQLRRLAGRYRCIAVDLPGHGVLAGQPFTIRDAIATVVAAIEAETPDGRATLVGLSLGGYVAIETAEARPDRVTCLVLAGCSAEPVGPVTMPFRSFAWLMEHLSPRALRVLNHAFFRTRYRRAISEPIIEGGFWSAGGSQALRIIIGRHYVERLGRLWTPVTIVNGALDPIFGPGGDPWASAARRGRSVIVPWALHLSNLDRPSTFSRLVAEAVEDALAFPVNPA
jgi:pimeloyl-ACP methyl ester carboxylesterase